MLEAQLGLLGPIGTDRKLRQDGMGNRWGRIGLTISPRRECRNGLAAWPCRSRGSAAASIAERLTLAEPRTVLPRPCTQEMPAPCEILHRRIGDQRR